MKEQIITSRKNAIIKETAELVSNCEQREKQGLFVVEGARICEDAAVSKTGIFRLFYSEKAYEKYREYIDKVRNIAKEIYIISPQVASALSSTKTSQEVFAVCEMSKEKKEIEGKILVMENLQDPLNVGAILRTGEAVGINTFIFLGDCCDVYSPKVTRGTMGAIFRLNFLKYDSLKKLLDDLNKKEYKCFAGVPNSKAKKISDVKFSEKTAVFVGNEGNGLTEECINSVENITIPMLGRAESLNASVAASIIMWEMVRSV